MKIKNWVKTHFFILLSAGLLLAFALVTSTGAIQNQFSAAIEVLGPLTIVEDVPMNFGRLRRPSSSQTFYSMASDGPLSIGGNLSGNFIDGQQPGQFTLIGEPAAAFTVSGIPTPASINNCTTITGDLTGVDFTLVDLSVGAGNFDANGKFTITVGGDITISPLATGGTGVCTFNIDLS